MRRGVKSSMTLLIFLSGRNESLVSIFTHRNAQQLVLPIRLVLPISMP